MASRKNSSAKKINRPKQTGTTELATEQVVDYLRQHPSFIEEHPELLDTLQVRHHQAGNSVSLIERQVAKLRENNLLLKQQMDQLVENVSDNDELFINTSRLVLAIITATSVEELAERVEHAFVHDFDADASALTLFTDGDELTSSTDADPKLSSDQQPGASSNVVSLVDAQHTIKSILCSSGAICGCFRPQELAFMFNDQATPVQSAAVTPIGEGAVLGILAVGSKNPDHYHSTIGTIFLNYVTEVLNSQLPRLLRAQSTDAH